LRLSRASRASAHRWRYLRQRRRAYRTPTVLAPASGCAQPVAPDDLRLHRLPRSSPVRACLPQPTVSSAGLSRLLSPRTRAHRALVRRTRYRSLQRLFGWLDDEGEIDGSPMAKMHARSSRSTNPSTCTHTVARPPWAAAGSVGPGSHGGSTLDERWGYLRAVPHLEQPAGHIRLRFSGRGDWWATMGE
jgi:hypothetical protein